MRPFIIHFPSVTINLAHVTHIFKYSDSSGSISYNVHFVSSTVHCLSEAQGLEVLEKFSDYGRI